MTPNCPAPAAARLACASACNPRQATAGRVVTGPHASLLLAIALAILALLLSGCAGSGAQYLTQERNLGEDLVARVENGMSREQVRAILGGPARIGTDRPSGQEEWMWRFIRYHYQHMCFYARFDGGGRVSGTATTLESASSDFFKPC